MAAKKIDLTNQRFGRLVAKYIVPGKDKATWWFCECDCGNTKETRMSQLRSKNIRSCGCFRKEAMSNVGKIKNKLTHGMSKTSLYGRWCDMIKRCYNPKCQAYKNYGGRGITVCDRWKDSFENYYEDMAPTFKPELRIERINNEMGYSPENCRWATIKEQNNNSRRNLNYKERYGLQ